MPKSVFISYVYEDKSYRDQLKDWANKGFLGHGTIITYERNDFRQDGDVAIKNEIKAMVQGSSAVIFLVGQNSHNHDWVEYEAQCSISKNKKILVIRIPKTTGQKPRVLLGHNEINFEASKIKNALEN